MITDLTIVLAAETDKLQATGKFEFTDNINLLDSADTAMIYITKLLDGSP